METVSDIFVSGNIKDINTATYGIEKNIPVLGLFCICRKKNMLFKIEIIKHSELLKNRNKERYIILGIAMGKKDAYALLSHIYEYVLKRGLLAQDIEKIF
ncbi:MAG: hypothetical protein VB120_00625 [Lachnospiraceae bacterium]|nr:hypothetical protein [Lachnospiraceae bacterium]